MKPLSYKLFFREDEDDLDFNDKYWDTGLGAAGCIFIAKDTGRILLAHRSGKVDFEPHTWGTWGGKIDEGETPRDAVVREVEEETGFDGEYKINPLWTFEDPEYGFKYHNYLVLIPFEFTPKLNWENDDSKWVEWGEWPKPMHFGLVALIKNATPTLTKIIKLIKRKKADILEDMQVTNPPSINVHTNNTLSSKFVNYIKTVENGSTGPLPPKQLHIYNVAGEPHIGYGHKVKTVELNKFDNGITQEYAEKLLKYDLLTAKKQVYSDIKSMFGVEVPLDDYQEEMLIDYAFNLGTLKKFPKFVRAVLTKDWDTAKKEYVRTYKDDGGKTHELGRDKIFFNTYLKNLSTIKKSSSTVKETVEGNDPYDTVIVKTGIVGEDVYEYEMRSPFSFIRYKVAPRQKLFYFDMIGTPRADDQGKGYAKAIMETFFQMVKEQGGALDCDTYSAAGITKIKPSIEKLAKQYGVRLVKGQEDECVDNYKNSATMSEGYGDPGEHVVWGGLWSTGRIVAHIVKDHNDPNWGHSRDMGPRRFVYFQEAKILFWHDPPDADDKEEVTKWLNKHGYDVERHMSDSNKWDILAGLYRKRKKKQ